MSISNESASSATESSNVAINPAPELNLQSNSSEISNPTTNLKSKTILTNCSNISSNKDNNNNRDTVFTLKKWNLVAMWSWDVECEVCAICRTPLMGKFK